MRTLRLSIQECQHVTRSSCSHRAAGVLLSDGDFLGHVSPVWLDCSSHCDPYLRQLSCKEWAAVEVINVEVVPLVVKGCGKSHHFLSAVWEGTIKQLGLLAIVNQKTIEVPSSTVSRDISFYPQGFGFPLRYCRNDTWPLNVMTDSSMAIC